jgi:hypothetical protein
MNRQQLVVAIILILLIGVALAASVRTFLATSSTSESTYTVPASAVRTSLGKTATTKTISLRLNSVSDVSNPATRDTWVKFNRGSVLYNLSLTPSPGERYLVANLTVTNVQPSAVHFSSMDFALLTPNNTAYYSNAAVCSASCSHALVNRTLSAGFTSNLYVLFSVPEGADVQKVVYTTSDPPIVMSAT